MRTIATTAAAFMFLSASAWADEPQNMPADEPILLSEAEMDEITAAG